MNISLTSYPLNSDGEEHIGGFSVFSLCSDHVQIFSPFGSMYEFL